MQFANVKDSRVVVAIMLIDIRKFFPTYFVFGVAFVILFGAVVVSRYRLAEARWCSATAPQPYWPAAASEHVAGPAIGPNVGIIGRK